jgi:hypothetical protein
MANGPEQGFGRTRRGQTRPDPVGLSMLVADPGTLEQQARRDPRVRAPGTPTGGDAVPTPLIGDGTTSAPFPGSLSRFVTQQEPIDPVDFSQLYDRAPRPEALAALSPGSLMDEPGYIRPGGIFGAYPVTGRRTDPGYDRIPLPVRALPALDAGVSQRIRSGRSTPQDITSLFETLGSLQNQLELRRVEGHDKSDADKSNRLAFKILEDKIATINGLVQQYQADVLSDRAQQDALERLEAQQLPDILRDQRQADERQADLRRAERQRSEARGEQQDQRMRNAQMLSTLFPDLGLSGDIMQSGIASDYIPVIVQLAMQRFQRDRDEQDRQRQMTQRPVFLPTVTTA